MDTNLDSTKKKSLSWLATSCMCLQLGIDPNDSLKTDQDRRKEKAVLLREFNEEVKRFTQKAAYVVGSGPDSNKRLAAALELARQALMRAEEDLEWEAN